MTSWSPALRVAWRDARRNKGLSLLVLSMIALPVLALTYGATTNDMFTLTPQESYLREAGTADALLEWRAQSPIHQDWRARLTDHDLGTPPPEDVTAAKVLALLPAGSAVVPYDEGSIVLRTAHGAGTVDASATDAADPLTRGVLDVVEGTAPTGSDQIAVTAPAATRLGVRIGDDVSTPDGTSSWKVTGVVELPADLGERVLFAAAQLPPEAQNRAYTRWLARTPAPVAWSQVMDLNKRGIAVKSQVIYADPPATPEPIGADGDPPALDLGLLVAGLCALEIILLVGPGFAVGARRRQRDLALVAANGGTPAHLRHIVLADGVVLGTMGAALGTLLGVVAAMLTRPLVEVAWFHSRAGGYRVPALLLAAIAALAIVTAVLAALVPAFTAGRLDVVTALTGRAATVRSRRRWILLGLALSACGVAVGGYGAATVSRSEILFGVVLLEAGLVLVTPALIGLLGRIGHLLPVSMRISLRDTSRNRASAAPAISAVMAAVAASMAVGMYYTNDGLAHESKYRASLPLGAAFVYSPLADQPGGLTSLRNAVTSAFPIDTVVTVKGYTCSGKVLEGDYCSVDPWVPPDQRCFAEALPGLTEAQQRQALKDPRCDDISGRVRYGEGVGTIVGDDGYLESVVQVSPEDLKRATSVLQAGGIVTQESRFVKNGRMTLTVVDTRKPHNGQDVPEEELPKVSAPAYLLTSGIGGYATVYSPKFIESLGYRVNTRGLVALAAAVPSQAQEDRLHAALLTISTDAERFSIIEHGPQEPTNPRLLIAALVAGLITLGATGIATGLAAADGRSDLTTLAAVGAAPGLRRRLSLAQAGVIAGLGSLLGAVAGGTASLAVLFAHNQATVNAFPVVTPYPLVIAWSNVLPALAVPLVAMAGAGLLTRSRLPTERPAE